MVFCKLDKMCLGNFAIEEVNNTLKKILGDTASNKLVTIEVKEVISNLLFIFLFLNGLMEELGLDKIMYKGEIISNIIFSSFLIKKKGNFLYLLLEGEGEKVYNGLVTGGLVGVYENKEVVLPQITEFKKFREELKEIYGK